MGCTGPKLARLWLSGRSSKFGSARFKYVLLLVDYRFAPKKKKLKNIKN